MPFNYTPTEKLDPVEQEYDRKYWRNRILLLIVVLLIGAVWWRPLW